MFFCVLIDNAFFLKIDLRGARWEMHLIKAY